VSRGCGTTKGLSKELVLKSRNHYWVSKVYVVILGCVLIFVVLRNHISMRLTCMCIPKEAKVNPKKVWNQPKIGIHDQMVATKHNVVNQI
jgi:hypothetical protein